MVKDLVKIDAGKMQYLDLSLVRNEGRVRNNICMKREGENENVFVWGHRFVSTEMCGVWNIFYSEV